MAIVYREIRIETGAFARIHIFPVRPAAHGRKSKFAPTRATQERLNRKNAANKLTDIINLNFTARAWSLRLNYHLFHEQYGRNPSDEEINREMHNFMRRLGRKYKKSGHEQKYVYSTEIGVRGGLVHHHIVLSEGLELSEIVKAWKCGSVGWSDEHGPHLYFDEHGAFDLAKYMIKDKYTYKSYSCSRNLKRPQETGCDKCIYKNDYRINQKRFTAIASNDIYEIHKLYPEWAVASLPDMEYAIDYDTGEARDARMQPFLTLWLYKDEGLSKNIKWGKKYGEEN